MPFPTAPRPRDPPSINLRQISKTELTEVDDDTNVPCVHEGETRESSVSGLRPCVDVTTETGPETLYSGCTSLSPFRNHPPPPVVKVMAVKSPPSYPPTVCIQTNKPGLPRSPQVRRSNVHTCNSRSVDYYGPTVLSVYGLRRYQR